MTFTHRIPTFYRHKLFWGFMLSILIGLAGCADESTTDTDIQKHLDRGQSYIDQGQYKAAIIEARNAIQKAPEDASGRLLLATVYVDLGQTAPALTTLNEIEDKNNAEYLFLTAQAFNQKRKYLSASKLLSSNESSLINANAERYLSTLAESQLGLSNYQDANKYYNQWLAMAPNSSEALVGMAAVAARQGDLELAYNHVNQALTNDPENIDALILQADINYQQGELTAAEDALTIALTSIPTSDLITPQRGIVLSQLANILTRQGRSTEALIYTRILAEALPSQAALKGKFEEAIALFKNSKLDQAEVLLEEIISEAPNHELAKQILGTIKYNKGDLLAAEQYFVGSVDPEIAPDVATLAFALTNMRLNQPDKVLELLGEKVKNSNDPQILGLYGMAAISADRFSEGEAALTKAVALAPDQSRLRMALANLYNNQSKPEEALKQLKLGYASTPADPYLQKALIRQFIALQQTTDANQLVEEIDKKFSDNVESLALVGSYQYFSGNSDKAIKTLKKALSLEPSNIPALQLMGTILLRSNQPKSAEDHFRKIIAELPEMSLGYRGLIGSMELQKNGQQAINEIALLAEKSASPAAYATLIEYYARNQQYEQANQTLATAQQQLEDRATLQQVSAQLALSEGRYAIDNNKLGQARIALMKGLKNSPENSQLQALLVKVEIADRNYLEANKLIDQLAAANGYLAMSLRGDLAVAQDQLVNALNHYTTLWDNSPSDNLAKRIYQIYRRQNNSAGSEEFLSKWSTAFPNSIALLTIRSNTAIGDSRYDDAINDLNRVLELQQARPSPAILNNLAWAYQQAGQLKKALSNAEKAYQLAPKSPQIADTYGWVLFKTGNKEKAKEILTLAQSLAPENKEIEGHLKQLNQ